MIGHILISIDISELEARMTGSSGWAKAVIDTWQPYFPLAWPEARIPLDEVGGEEIEKKSHFLSVFLSLSNYGKHLGSILSGDTKLVYSDFRSSQFAVSRVEGLVIFCPGRTRQCWISSSRWCFRCPRVKAILLSTDGIDPCWLDRKATPLQSCVPSLFAFAVHGHFLNNIIAIERSKDKQGGA